MYASPLDSPPPAAGQAPAGSHRSAPRARMARLALGRTLLLLTVLCIMAGLTVMAAFLLHRARHERQGMEERALALARSMAYAADREVAAAVARLEALSVSLPLRRGDLPALHAQLASAPTPAGTWFVLRAAEGQLLNTLRPAGDTTLPRDEDLRALGSMVGARTAGEAIRDGVPYVTPLARGPATGTPLVSVSFPVLLGEERRPALLQTIVPRERLAAVIFEQAMGSGWSGWLVDRNASLVAEPGVADASDDPQVLAAWTQHFGGQDREGLFVGTSPAGRPVLVAFARARSAEWTAAIGVPLGIVQRPLQEAMHAIAGSAAVLLLFATAAWWLRSRIERALTALRQIASDAGQREQQAEARFRHYWQYSPEGLHIVRVTPKGDFVYEALNPAHKQATGLSNTAISGRTPEECLPAEVAATVRQHYRHCTELGVPIRYTETLDLPGGRRDLEISLAPMHDPETGRVTMLFGTCRDVTERRRVEEAVRLNEERLRLSLRAAGAGTWDWDLATGAVHLSPEMRALLGLDLAVAGQKDLRAAWLDLIHPEDRRQVEDRLRAAVTRGGPFEVECRFFQGGAGGELHWMASRGRVVQQGGAHPRRRMLGVAVDVTERRRAELAARDSLALLQSSLDALTAHVAILDATGRIVTVNAAWRRCAEARGAGDTAGLGANYLAVCDSVQEVSPEAGGVGDGLRAVARGKVPEFRREYACAEPTAQEQRWYQLRVTRSEEGAGLRLVVAHEDITEVRRSAEALKAMTGRLLTLQDEERRRIARELHDTTVQDLAMAIVGLDLAAAGCGVEACTASLAEARGLLERAVRDVRTLSYLLHPPLLDECGLAVALTAYVEGFAKRSGLDCTLDLDDAPPEVVPPVLGVTLFRVAQEAFANVHRHSGARGMRVSLRVAAGEVVELHVEDDGRGFGVPGDAAEELRSLGVGILGMRARVRQLGGTLRIETGTDGRGSWRPCPCPSLPARLKRIGPMMPGRRHGSRPQRTGYRRPDRGRVASATSLLGHWVLVGPGVEGGDAAGDAGRVTAEVALVHFAPVVHHEGHDAGIAVAGRPGEHGEAAGHPPIHHIAHGATGRGRPLPLQDEEQVAIVGLRPFLRRATAAVAASAGCGDEGAERALGLALAGRPVEAIVLPGLEKKRRA